ncbi:Cell shape-determining protein MreC precursor [Pelotomaculum schinkii]|uniref:Cell shape-determining protein MreC n=1 Tax=Pelotomaculum schinkii TaxID=78350 RepID=A0A4Y7REZ3_9FIRM|nr:rod shape-determining protein MreC [Pelotomaculum schinkii]TEB07320.1 Cell shape-determining protein MreC precursor [Pelotomaculum schinkii]
MGWVTAKRLFFLVVLVAVTLAAIHVTIPEPARLTPLGSKFRDVLAPAQSGLTWLSRQARQVVSLPVSLYGAAERSQALEQEVERLQSEIIQLNEYKAENQRLTDLLNYKQVMVQQYDLLVASVIARDPGNWFATVTLNRGSRDGVHENMTVLTPQGLVGRVITVTNANCEVLLITDPRSGVGSLIQETRTPGIVEGTVGSSGTARIIHIPNDAQVEEGQVVVTSGLGSIFPKGIPIGQIASVSIESAGLFKSADIRLFAGMNQLEEVLIVTKVYPEAGTPPAGGG